MLNRVQRQKTLKIQIVEGRHFYAEHPIEVSIKKVIKIIC